MEYGTIRRFWMGDNDFEHLSVIPKPHNNVSCPIYISENSENHSSCMNLSTKQRANLMRRNKQIHMSGILLPCCSPTTLQNNERTIWIWMWKNAASRYEKTCFPHIITILYIFECSANIYIYILYRLVFIKRIYCKRNKYIINKYYAWMRVKYAIIYTGTPVFL